MPLPLTSPGDWTLASYFPSFDSPAFSDFRQSLEKEIAALAASASSLPPLADPAEAPQWAPLFLSLEEILRRFGHYASYVGCLSAADATAEIFAAEEARLASLEAALSKARSPLLAALAAAPAEAFAALLALPPLASAAHFLQRLREEGRFRMAPAEEALAAELGVDGLSAWGRLYDQVSGHLTFEMEYADGSKARLSISQARALMSGDNRTERAHAYRGYAAAWESASLPCAAALNALAGTRLTLYRRRGIDHFLQPALHEAGCTRDTLEALLAAVETEADFSRDILRFKARRLQLPALAWYDLDGPIPLDLDQPARVDWPEGIRWVRQSFHQAYPRLGDTFDRMIAERWIDFSPRPGKRPGGFCTGSEITGEPRIFMTYHGEMGSLTTLAHELGHAFHHVVMRDLRSFQRDYPMTLAESASTFAESILVDGLLASPDAGRAARLLVLQAMVNHIPSYLLNIPMRFTFEQDFYQQRASGEIPVSALRDAIVAHQRRWYGDTLASGQEDPWFWASKLHFYISSRSFYNFPYTFGFLLSRWLYNRFKLEGPSFLPRYEDFLLRSGSATCEEVARQALGANLADPAFWVEAIQSFRQPFHQLQNLLSPTPQP